MGRARRARRAAAAAKAGKLPDGSQGTASNNNKPDPTTPSANRGGWSVHKVSEYNSGKSRPPPSPYPPLPSSTPIEASPTSNPKTPSTGKRWTKYLRKTKSSPSTVKPEFERKVRLS
jgi:hypothetical protein